MRPTTLLALTLLLSGCATPLPIPPNTRVIHLDHAEVRKSRLGMRVELPAGDYAPAYRDPHGTYYLAPTTVRTEGLGIVSRFRGGVYIPDDTANQREELWRAMDYVMAPQNTYPLDRAVTYVVTDKTKLKTAPKPRLLPRPKYPEALLGQRIAGSATVEFTVTDWGHVKDAKVVRATAPAFGDAALAAIKRAIFFPGEVNGHPVNVKMQLPITFTPPDPAPPQQSP